MISLQNDPHMYVLPGKDIGTVPAKAVYFKRVHIKEFIIFFSNSTLCCLNN